MARRVEVKLLDDIDGGVAEETVRFALDGVQYEIDLSGRNADKLRKALEGFTSKARRLGRSNVIPIGRGKPNSNQPGRDKDLNNQIRKWSNDHGHRVGLKGRIPATVVAAYEANDPTMLPGYNAPKVDVTAVKVNLSEGGTAVKTAKRVPAQKKTPTKAAVAAAG